MIVSVLSISRINDELDFYPAIGIRQLLTNSFSLISKSVWSDSVRVFLEESVELFCEVL